MNHCRIALLLLLTCYFNSYAQNRQLNTTKLDIPYYTYYDSTAGELIIAGCRFNYISDKSDLFVARLNKEGKPILVKEFDMQDTCIIHVGGIFKEKTGWKIFVTGMIDSPYYRANKWGYINLDSSMQYNVGAQFFHFPDSSSGLSFMRAKQSGKTQDYYGVLFASNRERGINEFGYPVYWALNQRQKLQYYYSDSSTYAGDVCVVNDSLLFSISETQSLQSSLKWHDIKNNRTFINEFGLIYTPQTNMAAVPGEYFKFRNTSSILGFNDSSFILSGMVKEEFINPDNIKLDSLWNEKTVQYLIGHFFHQSYRPFDIDTAYKIIPHRHILTEPRKPVLPAENYADYHVSFASSARSQPIHMTKDGRLYFIRSYNKNGMFFRMRTATHKLTCLDQHLNIIWEHDFYSNAIIYSLASKPGQGVYVISAKGTGNIIYDDEWDFEYDDLDIEISGFDSTGFPTAVSELNIASYFEICVYPNPAKDLLTISGVKEAAFAHIFDYTGAEILKTQISESLNTIDTSVLKSGIYFLHINNGETRILKKFMVCK